MPKINRRLFIVAIIVTIISLILTILFLGSITNPASTSVKSKPTIVLPTITEFTAFSKLPAYQTGRSLYKTPNSDKIIAKVGNETIYQSDLETELKYYPIQTDAAKKILLDKMISDSKILQIGQEEGVVNLDKSNSTESLVWNSPYKDYNKRIDLVQKVENDLQNIISIKGVVVSIWYLNDRVGPVGYNAARQFALSKITQLQQAVRAGNMTIFQAADQVKNDGSLAQLDPMYKSNASFDFTADPSQKITWKKDFDDILRQLPLNGVTDIFEGNSYDFDHGGVKVPAYFMFGQVTQINKVASASLDDLISENSQKYAVTYF